MTSFAPVCVSLTEQPEENFFPKTLAASLIFKSGTVSSPATTVTYLRFCLCTLVMITLVSNTAAFFRGAAPLPLGFFSFFPSPSPSPACEIQISNYISHHFYDYKLNKIGEISVLHKHFNTHTVRRYNKRCTSASPSPIAVLATIFASTASLSTCGQFFKIQGRHLSKLDPCSQYSTGMVHVGQ